MARAQTIDTHVHYFPESYLKLIAAHGKRVGTSVVTDSSGNTFIQVGLHLRTGPIVSRFIDLDERIRDMDRQGVTMHALSLTQPMVYWADDDLGVKLCVAFNDAISAAHRAHPGRLIGFACLPLQNPTLALEELERAESKRSTWRPQCATANCRTPASSRSTSALPISDCQFFCIR
jgi:aminocarboxymuconate-semialdehyde decarboxylase